MLASWKQCQLSKFQPDTLGKQISFSIANVFLEFLSGEIVFQMSDSVLFGKIYKGDVFLFLVNFIISCCLVD
jgi:hypothetical protein